MKHESTLILPTKDEMERAAAIIASEPPVPLANLVDNTRDLRRATEQMASMLNQSRLPAYEWMKTALVFGLNLGIRIGEARAKAGTEYQRPM